MTKPPVVWNNVSMLTPGMKNLGNQFNKRWPGRDGTSDGAIGDYAHTQEKSDHNPDDTSKHNAAWDSDSDSKPEVRAIDVDNNLNDPDVSFQQVIDHMRKLPNLKTVIRYMIYDGKMYHERDNFNPTTYTGSSKHTEHGHFSGAWSQSADENTTFDFKFDELGDPMPTAQEVAKAVWDYSLLNPYSNVNQPAGTILRYVPSRSPHETTWGKVDQVQATLDAVASKVDISPEEIEAIKAAIPVPTAEENAEAVVNALAGVPTDQLAQALRNVLSDEQRVALAAALA